MNQVQDNAIKKSPSIDSIPDDVALILIEIIQSWAMGRGRPEQRHARRLHRDITLRSLSLTSKRAKEIYSSLLWENVTLSLPRLLPFSRLLNDESFQGSFIKSLTLVSIGTRESNQGGSFVELSGHDGLSALAGCSRGEIEVVTRKILSFMLGKLEDLQSLSLEVAPSLFQILQVETPSLMPFNFLTSTLKELKLAPFRNPRKYKSFSAVQDFDLLNEAHPTFAGLSKVKEVALVPVFGYHETDRRTWWGLPTEMFKVQKGDVRANDCTRLNSNCISSKSLFRSVHSLKHLRLFGLCVHRGAPPFNADYSVFKNLESLSFDQTSLWPLMNHGTSKLPSSLALIALCYFDAPIYTTPNEEFFLEEADLARLLIRFEPQLTNLKEVVVPDIPIELSGNAIDLPEKERIIFIKNRKELEKLDMFQSGRVRLTKFKMGETVGQSFKESPISSITWI